VPGVGFQQVVCFGRTGLEAANCKANEPLEREVCPLSEHVLRMLVFDCATDVVLRSPTACGQSSVKFEMYPDSDADSGCRFKSRLR